MKQNEGLPAMPEKLNMKGVFKLTRKLLRDKDWDLDAKRMICDLANIDYGFFTKVQGNGSKD